MNSSVQVNVSDSGGSLRPLWYQYPVCAAAPYAFVFYYAVKMVNLVVGTPCNLLVLWHISSRKSDSSTSDVFILHLALMDGCFGLVTPIDLVNRFLLGSSSIWYFVRFAYGVKDLAPLFLVCICLDRYTAVVHPVMFSRVRDNRPRLLISAVVWGLVLVYSVAKSLVIVVSVQSVQFEIFSGIILFAFAIMVFCNVSIIWALKRSVGGKKKMHPVKKKAFRMVLIILAIIVFNYLPPAALIPFVSRYTFEEYRCKISLCAFSLMDLSSSVEPLLYLTKMEAGCCGRQLETDSSHQGAL